MAQVSGWVRRPVRVATVDDDGRGGGGAMVGGADVGEGVWRSWGLRSARWISWFLEE